jgi:hypothetical protein
MPLAIVVNELVDVALRVELTEQEMIQDGVVEDHYARFFQGSAVDRSVKGIVAQMIEGHVGPLRRQLDAAELAESSQKGHGVVGYACTGGR